MKITMASFCLLLLGSSIQAQEEGIADNSFLIEEAYNQDPHVVQHISNLVYTKKTKDAEYLLTQEWPLFSHTHQISYAIPYSWLDGNSVNGIGDIAINYRYQLWDSDRWAAFSPRFTVILPTGDDKKELGSGKTAYQVNLPFSRKITPDWAVHLNVGATVTPGVSSGTKKENLWSYNVGGSVIWLMKNNFNLLIEWVSTLEDEIGTGGNVKNKASHVINPGVRYAYNAGSLQIVPGLAMPVELSGSKTKHVFFYLSFEHPF
jgi:hypothetical protein